jgi:hypothetical protein
MTELPLGETLTYDGRVYYVHGYSAMSVRPRYVLLRDVKTDKIIEVPLEEVDAADSDRDEPREPSRTDLSNELSTQLRKGDRRRSSHTAPAPSTTPDG